MTCPPSAARGVHLPLFADIANHGSRPVTIESVGLRADRHLIGLLPGALGGIGPSGWLRSDATAVNSSDLGGLPASDWQQACGHGSILGFAHIPAAASFSATYTQLSLVTSFSCAREIFAKRVAQGDYRMVLCGIDGATNPIAFVGDTSFNDFAGIQLVTPADSDAVSRALRSTKGGGRELPVGCRPGGGTLRGHATGERPETSSG